MSPQVAVLPWQYIAEMATRNAFQVMRRVTKDLAYLRRTHDELVGFIPFSILIRNQHIAKAR